MKKTNLVCLTLLSLLLILHTSCKKDKADTITGDASIATVNLVYTPSSTVYGGDYTFKLLVEKQGEVSEYGIVYKAWIKDASDKDPKVGDSGSRTIVFGSTLPSAGIIDNKKITLKFVDFNDANYRAYFILKSGVVFYGDIKYFVSA